MGCFLLFASGVGCDAGVGWPGVVVRRRGRTVWRCGSFGLFWSRPLRHAGFQIDEEPVKSVSEDGLEVKNDLDSKHTMICSDHRIGPSNLVGQAEAEVRGEGQMTLMMTLRNGCR